MTDKSRYPPVDIPDADIVTIPIPSGGVQHFLKRNEVYMPAINIRKGIFPDWRDHVTAVRDLKCRDDDVFICAFPKTGNHWLWEITTMLLSDRPDYTPACRESSVLEFSSPSELDNLASPRVFGTHLPYKLLPTEAVKKRAKIIFIQRNPKDIAVSYFNMLKNKKNFPIGNFDDWIHLFLFQPGFPMNWFDYTLEWEQVIKEKTLLNLHIIYYEDLKKDPIMEINRLSLFLGCSTDRTFISEVANKCSFQQMKKSNAEVKVLPILLEEKAMFDSLYRKGEIGDWKNWFTVAQDEVFDEVYKERMRNCSFAYQYNG